MTDRMTLIDRMLGALSAVVLLVIAYWGGMGDWRISVLGLVATAIYQLAWVRGRQSAVSARS